MSRKQLNNISIGNARIIFKNFSGRGTEYNREGDRNFCIIIEDPAFADDLIDEGWNVKIAKPRDEEDEPLYYLPVAVKYGDYPPEVYLVQDGKARLLDEDSVGIIDNADIICVNAVINPFYWERNGKEGIKAYAKTLYVEVEVDDFAANYEFE